MKKDTFSNSLDLANDPDEATNIFSDQQDIARDLMRRLGYFSYTKLPAAQFENVQEAYEWAHTSVQ